MKKVKWTCPGCQNGFSRKWNLIRHIKNIHHKEISVKHPPFEIDGSIINMKNSELLDLLKKKLNFNPAKNLNPFQDNNKYNNQNLIPPQHNPNTHTTVKDNSKENEFAMNEKNLDIIIEQIYPKFEKLERLIISGMPSPIKNHLLGKILADAFIDKDPLGFLDKTIKNLQTKYQLNRILEYVSFFYGTNKTDAWVLLIHNVRNRLFKKAYE